MKTIVILGSSFAGVTTAHRLLKQASNTDDVKVILVGPTTHIFWNLATPRAIIPGQFSDDQLFGEIAPGFKKYTTDRFQFVIGAAQRLDLESKNVVVATEGEEKLIGYDVLILATGSRTKGDAPFKGRESYKATLDMLHDFQDRVKKATSIVVGGAGATGVETAGELGFEYGTNKKITLISSGARILEGTPTSVSKAATKQLQDLKVTIRLKTEILSSTTTPDGRTELLLSGGHRITTDLYLPSVGVAPNSSYLPRHMLDKNGFVVVDGFLRVKGTTDIWAVGDISNVQRPQYVNMEQQSIYVAKSIRLAMNGKGLVPYPLSKRNTLAVLLGRKAGTGHTGGLRFPSFLIVMIKGKAYLAQKMDVTIAGSDL